MRGLRNERGESLIELLITMLILGTGMVAVVAALGTLVIASDAHHSQAEGEVIVRDYGESIKAAAMDSAFVACPTDENLDPDGDTTNDAIDPALAGDGWRGRITQVWYWIPSSSAATFPNGTWSDPIVTDPATADEFDGNACQAHFEDTCGVNVAACAPGLVRVEYELRNDRTDYGSTTMTGRVLVRRNNAAVGAP